MSCEEALRRIEERLAAIEGMLEMILSELRESKQRGEPRGRAHPLIEEIRKRLFIPVNEIRSRTALRRLMERGEVVVLRDEGANREVVTVKDVVRRLLEKLPMRVEDAARLDEREYELLQILNRLGYVLVRDGKYVRTELAQEFEL